MSAVSIPSRKMPWQTKAERVSVLAALAIKKEMVMQRLVKLREDVGHPDRPGKPLPVEEAAARAGVKYRTWQRWEAGDSIPYARNLSAIADAFEFDVGEFYDSSGDKAPTPDPFESGGVQEQLEEIRRQLADAQSERVAIRKLLATQEAILERIEKATAENDDSTQRLDAAAAEMIRRMREAESAAQSLAEARTGTGGSGSPPASS